MKKYIVVVFVCLELMCCNYHKRHKIESNDPVYQVENEDKEMNAAITHANQSLKQFDDALNSGNTNFKDFCLKVRYDIPTGGEHIWVADIINQNGKYFGLVADEPQSIRGLKMYDKVQINMNNISDWMYIDNGKLRGGYTLKVLRDRMSLQERNEFDSTSGFVIEE